MKKKYVVHQTNFTILLSLFFCVTSAVVFWHFLSPQKGVLGTTTIPGLPLTDMNIHLGIPFDGSISTKDLVGMDIAWGTFTGKRNPNVYALGYIPYDRDPTSTPKRDITWWKNNHPDWIVYQCDKTTPAYEFGDYNVPIDITNPLVQAYQLQFVKQILANNDGVAWDNVDTNNFAKRCGIWKNGQWKQLYSGALQDTVFRNDVVSWAKNMYAQVKNIKATAGVSINMSIEPFYNDTAKKIETMAPYFDILFDERGFTNWGKAQQNFLTDAAWQEEVNAAILLAQLNKGLILNAEEPDASEQQTSLQERLWVLANYLLVKGSFTYTYISAPPQHYGFFNDLPEYHLPVGQPIVNNGQPLDGSYFQDQGVYWRRFTNALVLVNPSSTASKTVTFPGTFTDTSGTIVQSPLTLAAHTGLILLRSSAFDPSDVNHDGVVNILDYNILMSCYGKRAITDTCLDINKDHHDKTRGLYADIDNDGTVDGVDYNIWLRTFIGVEKAQ